MADSKKVEAARQQAIKSSIAKYAYFNALTDANPELQGFLNDLKKVIKSSKTGGITQDEFNALTRKYTWFTEHDSKQQAAEMEQALDKQNNTNLYGEAVDALKRTIGQTAETLGVPVSDADLTLLATQAKYNGWDAVQTKAALEKQLAGAGELGDLKGNAGSFQSNLQEWAARNGMDIPAETLNRMITSGAFGKQTLDDMKAELRKTYLAGANPAWADKIAAGADPYDISAPYRSRVATLLERGDADSVTMNDPLIQRAMQYTDSNGKPGVLPLYEFDKMIRSTDDWKKTDNAYATYSGVADNILKMFGFR